MEDIELIEKAFADKTAAEYRSRGYEVFREQPLDFLPGFRADLLVRRGDETKVIAVQTRTSLAVKPEIRQLADALSSKPNWSFELLLISEPERLDAPEGARPFAEPDIGRRIEEAESALAAGFNDAAFLLAWSASEAAVRILVNAAGVEIKRVTWPSHVLGHAATLGIISDEDDKFLSEMLAYRNALSHGFETHSLNKGRVEDLIVAAKKLRRAAASPAPVDTSLDARPHLLDPLDVPARLDELRGMRDGWLNGDGKAPNHAELDWLSTSFERNFPNDLPLPHIFLTPQGGIQAEWSLGSVGMDFEVDLDTHRGHGLFLYFGSDTDSPWELSLNLDDANDWLRLANQIREPLRASV